MKAHLTKIQFIEAAHRNPAGGPAQQRLHGHSYRIELLAEGEVDPAVGWLVDYADIKRLFQPLNAILDHGYLNNIPDLAEDTTLKGLERWIAAHMMPKPPWFAGVRASILGDLAFRPTWCEADKAAGLPARIRFTFEAAQSLPQLPEGHPCRRMHGHSYRLEVAAPDLKRLEPHLAVLYDTLDHRYLNDIEGLDHATCERISRWVWEWLERRGERPSVVVIQETPGARCVFFDG